MPEKKLKKPKSWCLVSELAHFQQGRLTGQISFFRINFCLICGAEIPKGKKWCSRKCAYSRSRKKREDGADE